MKIQYNIFLIVCLILLAVGCNKESAWPDPPEVPKELVFEVFPEEVNVISDSDFAETELEYDLVNTVPVLYDTWGIVNSIPDNTELEIKESGDEQGNVLSITNGANGISSGSYNQAYVGQRVMAKAKPAIYKLSFKARQTSGKGTLRTFVLSTGEGGSIIKNFFVIHHNQNDPYEATPADKSYTMFCTHKPLTAEWTDYIVYVNMGRTTDITAKTTFSESKVATEEDLKAYTVCFSSGNAESEIQIDDVEFSLVKDREPETPLENPEIGVNIVKDSDFEKADMSRNITSLSPVFYGDWGIENLSDIYSYQLIDDGAQGKALKISSGETTVPSGSLMNSYIGQRLYTKATQEVYKVTFKAKKTTADGTLRIFMPVTSEDGAIQKKFFIVHFNNDDPYAETTDGQKYTMHCRHVQLTEEWGEYVCYFDLRRTTVKTSSANFNDTNTAASSEEDLQKFLICFSVSSKSSEILIDDVTFTRIPSKPVQ